MKQLYILEVILVIISSGLILTNFIFPHTTTVLVPHTVQVPHQVNVQREQTLDTKNNLIISGGYYTTLPSSGVYINSGKTLKLLWSADGSLDVYILTETQFEYFKVWGTTSNYEAHSYGKEGTISANIKHDDKYYAVVSNTPLFGSSVKLYQAQAILVWQETITQYQNETEYVPKEVKDNLYLYSGLIIAVIGIAILIYKKSRHEISQTSCKKFSKQGYS